MHAKFMKLQNYKLTERNVEWETEENQGKISAQPHTIAKQICFPTDNVLFLSLFSLSKN